MLHLRVEGEIIVESKKKKLIIECDSEETCSFIRRKLSFVPDYENCENPCLKGCTGCYNPDGYI